MYTFSLNCAERKWSANFSFRTKSFLQTEHSWGRSWVCDRTWLRMSMLVTNILPQSGHLNAGSPVWRCLWSFKPDFWLNALGHKSHWNFLSFKCGFWWLWRAPRCANDLLHSGQRYGRAAEWLLEWSPSCVDVGKCLGQIVHLKNLSRVWILVIWALRVDKWPKDFAQRFCICELGCLRGQSWRVVWGDPSGEMCSCTESTGALYPRNGSSCAISIHSFAQIFFHKCHTRNAFLLDVFVHGSSCFLYGWIPLRRRNSEMVFPQYVEEDEWVAKELLLWRTGMLTFLQACIKIVQYHC